MLLRGFALIIVVLFGCLAAACATQSLSLSKQELDAIRIVAIDFSWEGEAVPSWPEAEQDFVQKVHATPHLAKQFKPAIEKARQPVDETLSDASVHSAIVKSPEGRTYLRGRAEGILRRFLEQSVVPKFQGTRHVRLSVHLFSFQVPSAVQRVVLGGAPALGAVTKLVDVESGQVLGKMDKGAAGHAGAGVIGVLIDQAYTASMEERVAASYAQQVLDWLKGA